MGRKPYKVQDHYFLEAKKQGFAARSAFKLQEIQKRHKVLNKGNRVLDLGCAPGSWSQYAAEVIGPRGWVEGFDLKEVSLSLKNARFQVKDVFELNLEDVGGEKFDVLISDMAPNTSGVPFRDQARSEELCHKVLEMAPSFLKPGGNLVMKLFMGPGDKDLENATRGLFQQVKRLRPDSTRKSSKEIFVIGLGFKSRSPTFEDT